MGVRRALAKNKLDGREMGSGRGWETSNEDGNKTGVSYLPRV